MTPAIQLGARLADRWVIAVRVSTEQQEVAQQLDALQDAARRHAAEVVEVVRIEGVSAWDRKTCRLIEAQMLMTCKVQWVHALFHEECDCPSAPEARCKGCQFGCAECSAGIQDVGHGAACVCRHCRMSRTFAPEEVRDE